MSLSRDTFGNRAKEQDELEKKLSSFEKYIQSTFAEFIGTALFTFVACLAVSSRDVLSIAFAEGLCIALLCAAFVNISGGHFNPALSFAAAICGAINPILAVLYFVAQTCGAMVGASFVKAVILGDSYHILKGGANQFRGLGVPYDPYDSFHHLNVTPVTAIVVEAILSCLIFTVYLQANIDKKSRSSMGPMAYGFALIVAIISGFHVSGGSFNPARSFGPAVPSGYWDQHYIYWAGPYVGALVSGVMYRLILGDGKKRLIMRD
ncbi:putative aquaporin-8 [Apostichopus japonicus]|uniref:Putative aquaporin-8 n=1 Tax=Stichopus japonicus TaxID=307972 RepID=A0A2G8KU37_STIJA|nr:putative aquaporin-8 [Apostichopus japonicus]